jgi:hypothetical protein
MRSAAIILYSLLSVLLISCTQNRNENGANTGKMVSDSTDISGIEAEVFEEFMKRFSEEESFQLKRIKFPISVIIPDAGHEGMAPIKETIGKYEWEPLDLTYDSTYLTRTYDKYYQVVRFNNDTAVVEIRGIDNGIYADYYFELIDNKWYLVTLYEASF